jgi:hypothetical protein
MRQNGKSGDSIDVLLTGCEVSLWVLEQFASDLTQVGISRRSFRCRLNNLAKTQASKPLPPTHRFSQR